MDFAQKWMQTIGAIVAVTALSGTASAELVRFEEKSREDPAAGKSFGTAGPYEVITGTGYFSIDPSNAANLAIADAKLAAEKGRTTFSSDIVIVAPKDRARGNGSVIVDVVNRGNILSFNYFNSAARAADRMVGNGFLMERGFTVVAVGWEHDIAPSATAVRATLPADRTGARSFARADVVPNASASEIEIPASDVNPPSEPDEAAAALRVYPGVLGTPALIARSAWRWTSDRRHVHVDGGVKAGDRYELVYTSSNPTIIGLGFAAIRDAGAAVRAHKVLPVAPVHVYAFGVSQTGRFMRQFLYQGFNADESGHQVFDAVMIHIAGGSRGSFNTRFGSPTNLATYEYAARYPFADEAMADPATGQNEGLLDRLEKLHAVPKIIYTNTAVEYWGGRAASLLHTTLDGSKDTPLAPTTRVYAFAGAPHSPAAFPPSKAAEAQQIANPLDYRPGLRALLVAMDRWVTTGAEPPKSRYPTVAAGQLVAPAAVKVPAMLVPFGRPQSPPVTRIDLGPAFSKTGVPTVLPAKAGAAYGAKVFAVDADGNDIGGVRLPDVAVPVATFTGWNLRAPEIGSPTIPIPLQGSYVPFAATKAARQAGDTRLSLEERYADVESYVSSYTEATKALIAEGYLLADDLPGLLAHAREHYNLVAHRSAR